MTTPTPELLRKPANTCPPRLRCAGGCTSIPSSGARAAAHAGPARGHARRLPPGDRTGRQTTSRCWRRSRAGDPSRRSCCAATPDALPLFQGHRAPVHLAGGRQDARLRPRRTRHARGTSAARLTAATRRSSGAACCSCSSRAGRATSARVMLEGPARPRPSATAAFAIHAAPTFPQVPSRPAERAAGVDDDFQIHDARTRRTYVDAARRARSDSVACEIVQRCRPTSRGAWDAFEAGGDHRRHHPPAARRST